jgi:hypothetical protein
MLVFVGSPRRSLSFWLVMENSDWDSCILRKRKNLNLPKAYKSWSPIFLFLCYCYNGMRLCLCGTVAINWSIVQPADDAWMNMEQQWDDTDQGKPKDLEKNLSQCHFVRHKSHWTSLGANLGLCCEKPATNHLCYGMALLCDENAGSYLQLPNKEMLRPVLIMILCAYHKTVAQFTSLSLCVIQVWIYTMEK